MFATHTAPTTLPSETNDLAEIQELFSIGRQQSKLHRCLDLDIRPRLSILSKRDVIGGLEKVNWIPGGRKIPIVPGTLMVMSYVGYGDGSIEPYVVQGTSGTRTRPVCTATMKRLILWDADTHTGFVDPVEPEVSIRLTRESYPQWVLKVDKDPKHLTYGIYPSSTPQRDFGFMK